MRQGEREISHELKCGFSGAVIVHALFFGFLYMQVKTLPKIETIIAPSSLEVRLVASIQPKKSIVKKIIEEQKKVEKIIEVPNAVKSELEPVQEELNNSLPVKQFTPLIKTPALEKVSEVKQDVPKAVNKNISILLPVKEIKNIPEIKKSKVKENIIEDRLIHGDEIIEKPPEDANLTIGAYVEAKEKQSQNKPPSYPRLARERGHEGTAILRIQITSKGLVNGVQLLETSGFKMLDKAAIKSVKEWKFQPATRFGMVVKSVLEIQFVFKLNEIKGDV